MKGQISRQFVEQYNTEVLKNHLGKTIIDEWRKWGVKERMRGKREMRNWESADWEIEKVRIEKNKDWEK